jgi:predicted transcriptional regulator
MPESADIVEVVLNRDQIFHVVCKEMPEKRDLEHRVSKSRPTIDRAIRELEEENLVYCEGGLCKPTSVGRLAHELYERFEKSFTRLSEIEDELIELPSETTLPSIVFYGASLLQPPDYAPYSTIGALVDDLAEAAEVTVVTPILITPYLNKIADRRSSSQLDVRLIVTEEVAEMLMSDTGNTQIASLTSQDLLSVSDDVPQYGLVLIDRRITYTLIFSGTNHLSAAIRNTRPDAVEWTKKRIDEIRTRSQVSE